MTEETDPTAEATDAAETDTRLRFVLTVEGDGETGTIKAEAWKYDKDGSLIEAAPVKQRDADNVVVALYDGGTFFQLTSLLLARTMALASGDVVRAIKVDLMAEELGLELPPIGGEKTRARVQSTFTDAIASALAGEG